jgi:NAD(P)-dependent dehydrogenase (short-subunit alcohol dehydrogenase family)
MNIIVTGASRGIGFELAKKFAADSSNKVFAFSRNKEKLEKLAAEIKTENASANIFCKDFDLNTGNIQAVLLPFILGKVGAVDILINNAGLLINKAFPDLTDNDFDQVFSVNLKSAFRLTRELLPYFSVNSHVVNITSMGGVQGSVKFPGLSLYSASKGALGILTECLAEELKDRNIKVNALAIGAVQTEMLSEAFPGYEAPLSASEIAEFIYDFAIKGHSFFNGKILPVSSSTP